MGFGTVGLFVRKGGIFQKIGTFRNQKEAILKGRNIVSNTASASFKIDEPVQKDPLLSGLLSRSQFYASQKEPGVFIEKREKRIKSRGELREITFKGIAKQRTHKGILNVFGG